MEIAFGLLMILNCMLGVLLYQCKRRTIRLEERIKRLEHYVMPLRSSRLQQKPVVKLSPGNWME